MTATSRPLPTSARRTPTGAAGFVAAVLTAAIVAIVLCAVIAAIAHGAGASHSFRALKLATFTPFVVVGLLAGATAWTFVNNRASNPRRLLTWLVPTVVLVSLVPDVLVGASGSMPGSSWGAVTALMAMHLVVAVCGVVSFRLFLPVATSSEVRAPAGR